MAIHWRRQPGRAAAACSRQARRGPAVAQPDSDLGVIGGATGRVAGSPRAIWCGAGLVRGRGCRLQPGLGFDNRVRT